ncbi:hypothetical protein OH76DRAFT_1055726 [Lentinus brumalis]|uniref:Uncharacterized protein n=1 Tax=Lentinus brumalis TaxID=2498619 RepID=A0A371DNB1_9APHY|nr:hypothetical protein OH76DRAFT_1055726 [Polyporus brumalis]
MRRLQGVLYDTQGRTSRPSSNVLPGTPCKSSTSSTGSVIPPRMTMLEETRAASASNGHAQDDASLRLHDQVTCVQFRGSRTLEGADGLAPRRTCMGSKRSDMHPGE